MGAACALLGMVVTGLLLCQRRSKGVETGATASLHKQSLHGYSSPSKAGVPEVQLLLIVLQF